MPGNGKLWVSGKPEMEHPRDTYGDCLADTIACAIGPLRNFAELLEGNHEDYQGAALAGNVLHSLVEHAESKLDEYNDALKEHYGKRLYVVRQGYSPGSGAPAGTLVGVEEYDDRATD